jgi:hypothetical protein
MGLLCFSFLGSVSCKANQTHADKYDRGRFRHWQIMGTHLQLNPEFENARQKI